MGAREVAQTHNKHNWNNASNMSWKRYAESTQKKYSDKAKITKQYAA